MPRENQTAECRNTLGVTVAKPGLTVTWVRLKGHHFTVHRAADRGSLGRAIWTAPRQPSYSRFPSHEHLWFTILRAAHACSSPVADVHVLTEFARPPPVSQLSRRVRPRAALVRVQSNLGVALLGLAVVANVKSAVLVATHECLQLGASICAFRPVVPRERERYGFPPPLIVPGGVGDAVVTRVLWARDVVVGPL